MQHTETTLGQSLVCSIFDLDPTEVPCHDESVDLLREAVKCNHPASPGIQQYLDNPVAEEQGSMNETLAFWRKEGIALFRKLFGQADLDDCKEHGEDPIEILEAYGAPEARAWARGKTPILDAFETARSYWAHANDTPITPAEEAEEVPMETTYDTGDFLRGHGPVESIRAAIMAIGTTQALKEVYSVRGLGCKQLKAVLMKLGYDKPKPRRKDNLIAAVSELVGLATDAEPVEVVAQEATKEAPMEEQVVEATKAPVATTVVETATAIAAPKARFEVNHAIEGDPEVEADWKKVGNSIFVAARLKGLEPKVQKDSGGYLVRWDHEVGRIRLTAVIGDKVVSHTHNRIIHFVKWMTQKAGTVWEFEFELLDMPS